MQFGKSQTILITALLTPVLAAPVTRSNDADCGESAISFLSPRARSILNIRTYCDWVKTRTGQMNIQHRRSLDTTQETRHSIPRQPYRSTDSLSLDDIETFSHESSEIEKGPFFDHPVVITAPADQDNPEPHTITIYPVHKEPLPPARVHTESRIVDKLHNASRYFALAGAILMFASVAFLLGIELFAASQRFGWLRHSNRSVRLDDEEAPISPKVLYIDEKLPLVGEQEVDPDRGL